MCTLEQCENCIAKDPLHSFRPRITNMGHNLFCNNDVTVTLLMMFIHLLFDHLLLKINFDGTRTL